MTRATFYVLQNFLKNASELGKRRIIESYFPGRTSPPLSLMIELRAQKNLFPVP